MIKYIHIAAHCRRYRNFATMSQITMALGSNEVSRLSKTWRMVPPSDVRTLRDLDALVSPTRNFYNLRAEMESVGITNSNTGCIPFVGIYTPRPAVRTPSARPRSPARPRPRPSSTLSAAASPPASSRHSCG